MDKVVDNVDKISFAKQKSLPPLGGACFCERSEHKTRRWGHKYYFLYKIYEIGGILGGLSFISSTPLAGTQFYLKIFFSMS